MSNHPAVIEFVDSVFEQISGPSEPVKIEDLRESWESYYYDHSVWSMRTDLPSEMCEVDVMWKDVLRYAIMLMNVI